MSDPKTLFAELIAAHRDQRTTTEVLNRSLDCGIDVCVNLVRQLRERAGLTQELLARATGISKSAIWRLENDHVSPTLETLQRLAEAIGLNIVITLQPRSRDLAKSGGSPFLSWALGYPVHMAESHDTARKRIRLDPKDRRWLDARLAEYRELLAYLRDR